MRELAPAARLGRTVSSGELARSVSVSAAQVRRDLAVLGHLGQRGVGYDAQSLVVAIRQALGTDRAWRAVLVGVGNLARALLKSQTFRGDSLSVVAIFDSDPAKLHRPVEGLTVEPVEQLGRRVAQLNAQLGILTVPAEVAPGIARTLADSGIAGVMNFAPVNLELPDGVPLVEVDLGTQFEQLTFLVRQREHHA